MKPSYPAHNRQTSIPFQSAASASGSSTRGYDQGQRPSPNAFIEERGRGANDSRRAERRKSRQHDTSRLIGAHTLDGPRIVLECPLRHGYTREELALKIMARIDPAGLGTVSPARRHLPIGCPQCEHQWQGQSGTLAKEVVQLVLDPAQLELWKMHLQQVSEQTPRPNDLGFFCPNTNCEQMIFIPPYDRQMVHARAQCQGCRYQNVCLLCKTAWDPLHDSAQSHQRRLQRRNQKEEEVCRELEFEAAAKEAAWAMLGMKGHTGRT